MAPPKAKSFGNSIRHYLVTIGLHIFWGKNLGGKKLCSPFVNRRVNNMTQWARKFQKVQAKKTREIKSITFTKKFLAKLYFCHFKNSQKSIFEQGKSLKLPKMQFHEKNSDLLDFTSFFAWTFLNFLARSV